MLDVLSQVLSRRYSNSSLRPHLRSDAKEKTVVMFQPHRCQLRRQFRRMLKAFRSTKNFLLGAERPFATLLARMTQQNIHPPTTR